MNDVTPLPIKQNKKNQTFGRRNEQVVTVENILIIYLIQTPLQDDSFDGIQATGWKLMENKKKLFDASPLNHHYQHPRCITNHVKSIKIVISATVKIIMD